MHLCLSKFSTIYSEPRQRKLPFSDRFTHAEISWISYVTSRSPIYGYGYVYITRTRKPEPGYLNLSINCLLNAFDMKSLYLIQWSFDKMYLCRVRCQTTCYVFAFVMVLNQTYVPALVYTIKVPWNFEWFVRNVWWNWLDVFLKPFLQIIQKTYLCKISTVTQKIW
jgi:hypothetical protein